MGQLLEQPEILVMGTYPPRECGIATFTQDLTTAINVKFNHKIKTKILAMNRNRINIYNYPEEVAFQLEDSNLQEYIDLAKKINQNEKIKLINIQHEFGIFGGEYGSYLIAFLEIIKKPVVITFHSVLPQPDYNMKRVVQTLAKKSECIVVMAEKGREILREVYGLKTKIEVVPHGIPTVPFVQSSIEKTKKGLNDKIVLSSFGMISSGKGYEQVINALPNVVKKFPNLLYLIIGETHPVVRKQEGESYRNFIEQKIKKLKLEKNVKFYNRYVTLEEIVQYLQATDIFICSNNNPDQITSGTLAYAMGAGRAVISTPFLHAQELVTPDKGLLVKFKNSKSFENAILKLLFNPKLKQEMEENAYANTRKMTWNNVALAYHDVFKKHLKLPKNNHIKIPPINLNYLNKLTDNFGVIQFAHKTEPDPSSGYTLDDTARAMIACSMHYDLFKKEADLDLLEIYINFNQYVQQENGQLYNIVEENKKVRLDKWSDDAHGRALWSLGFLINTKSIPESLRKKAVDIFNKASKVKNVQSPRAVAFTILGWYFFNQAKPVASKVKRIKELANYLVTLYRNCATDDWQWFEESLTYSNSKLSEALFYAYIATQEKKYLDIGQASLGFLKSITFEGNIFAPIGQNGWYLKDGQKAHFDQQPVDTASMVQTLLLANQVTKKKEYYQDAMKVFYWFLGKNHLKQIIYDETTGGCYDGLGEFSINLNQGAESTISYQLARLSLDQYKVQNGK